MKNTFSKVDENKGVTKMFLTSDGSFSSYGQKYIFH